MKVIHIDSGVMGEMSFSRMMSAKVMERLKAQVPDADVTYLDLATDPVPHLHPSFSAAMVGLAPADDPAVKEALVLGNRLLDDFLAADTVVIGASLYNLSISSALKAWFDRIMINGKTFRYTPEGELVGLAAGKRVILCISRGGFYNEGSPGAPVEHCESLLRALFAFIGIPDVEVIAADGTTISPDHRQAAEAKATEEIAALEF